MAALIYEPATSNAVEQDPSIDHTRRLAHLDKVVARIGMALAGLVVIAFGVAAIVALRAAIYVNGHNLPLFRDTLWS